MVANNSLELNQPFFYPTSILSIQPGYQCFANRCRDVGSRVAQSLSLALVQIGCFLSFYNSAPSILTMIVYIHAGLRYPHEDVFPAAHAGCMVDTPWIFKWVETIVLGVGWYSIWDNVI